MWVKGTVFSLVILPCFSLAQIKGYMPAKHSEKYFASFFYGNGKAHWISTVSYTDLYNSDGNLIKPSTDKLDVRINNASKTYGLEVSAPYSAVRLGLGINFENFYLDKLILSSTSNRVYLPFNDSFRFDKIGMSVEYPLPYFEEERFTISTIFRFGYYGFSKVAGHNFFGGPYLGNTFYIGLGVLADLEIVPRYFLFVILNGEYKHYRNSSKELPSIITHKIYTGTLQVGVRINVFDYDFVKRIILGKD